MSRSTIAMACRTCVAKFARTTASRATEVESHGPGHLRNLAGPGAFRTLHYCSTSLPTAIASCAGFLALNTKTDLGAFDGLPEINVQRIFQICALFRSFATCRAASTAPEKLAEQIAKAATAAGREILWTRASATIAAALLLIYKIAKIEPAEIHSWSSTLCAWITGPRHSGIGIEPHLIVHLLLFRITQNIVGFLNCFEAILGRLIAWIQVRVMLPRQTTVDLADLLV